MNHTSISNEIPAIQIQNASRSYGSQTVLRDLTLKIPFGQVYGFLGRNGSGKTTTLKLLAGLIKPHSGTVNVLGTNPFTMPASTRIHLGYMSESLPVPDSVRVGHLIDFCSSLYPAWDRELVSSLLGKHNINPSKRLSALSQGNQRLLFFVLAIAPRPKVLLLDEPAANLDVVARREILDEILNLCRDISSTVFFSTHILSDLERVADHVGILVNGQLKISEPLDSLKESIRIVRFHSFNQGLPGETDIPKNALRARRDSKDLTLTLRLENRPSTFDQPAALATNWACQHEVHALNLEDIFVELSRA